MMEYLRAKLMPSSKQKGIRKRAEGKGKQWDRLQDFSEVQSVSLDSVLQVLLRFFEKDHRYLPRYFQPHVLCRDVLTLRQIYPAYEYCIYLLKFFSQYVLCPISYLEQFRFLYTVEQFGFGCYTVVVCSFLEMSHDTFYCAINTYKTMTFGMRRKCKLQALMK